jgi:hypothetical protein
MATMTVDKFLRQRDTDAALYLLGRMLNLRDAVLREHRPKLEELHKKVSQKKRITADDRRVIACTYREVVG